MGIMFKALQALLCISHLGSSASAAYHFTCPDVGTSETIPASDIVQAASSSAGGITIDNTSASGNLCTLTLQDADTSNAVPLQIPVARSFDGYDWEVTAGPLSQILPSPTCSASVCTFRDLPLPAQNKAYALTSYSHSSPGTGPEVDAARFLEQATFGPTQETIDSLVASSSSSTGEDKYMNWVKHQIENVPMSSHREHYRRRANPVSSWCETD